MRNEIWSSNIKIEDWAEYLKEEYPEVKDEIDQYNLVAELNNEYLQDERVNLNIPTDGKILIIARLGLWNGPRSAYKILEKKNISEILYDDSCDDITWYCDGHNVKGEGSHHDGNNYYEYREIRKDKEDSVYRLLDRIYNNKPISRKMINYYTKSIAPQVKKVYGW